MSSFPSWSLRRAIHLKSTTLSLSLALFIVLALSASVTWAQSVSPGTAQPGQTVTVNIPATGSEFAFCTINGNQYAAYNAQSISYTIPAGTPPGTHIVGTCQQGGLNSLITVQVSEQTPIDNDGDNDQDGFPNSQDACPNQGDLGYGMQNNGCPNPAPQQQPSTAVPPTSIPLAVLPQDGRCYVATLGGGYVNVRDTASLDGAAFANMNPSLAYPASQAQNDSDGNVWYFLDDFAGWVAGYVTRQTTPCFNLPVISETLDRDGDGVLDANDACPDAFGYASEIAEINGCPLTTYAAPGYNIPDDLLDVFNLCPILLQTAEVLPGFVMEELGANSNDICGDTSDLSSVLLAYDYDDAAGRLGDAGLYMLDNCPSLYFLLLDELHAGTEAEVTENIALVVSRFEAGNDLCGGFDLGPRMPYIPGASGLISMPGRSDIFRALAIRDIRATCGFSDDISEALYELVYANFTGSFDASFCPLGTLLMSLTDNYRIALQMLADRCGATTAAALTDAAAIIRYAIEAGVSERDLLANLNDMPCDVAGGTDYIDSKLASNPEVDARDPLVPPQLSDCPALSRALQEALPGADSALLILISILNSADPCAAAQAYLDTGIKPTDLNISPEAELCFATFVESYLPPSLGSAIRLSDGKVLDGDSSWADWMSILHLDSARWCTAEPREVAEPVGEPLCYGVSVTLKFNGETAFLPASFSVGIANIFPDGRRIQEMSSTSVTIERSGIHAAAFSAWVQDRSTEGAVLTPIVSDLGPAWVVMNSSLAPQDEWYCRTGFASIDVSELPADTILHGDDSRADDDGSPSDDDGLTPLIPDTDFIIRPFIPRFDLPDDLFPTPTPGGTSSDDDRPEASGDLICVQLTLAYEFTGISSVYMPAQFSMGIDTMVGDTSPRTRISETDDFIVTATVPGIYVATLSALIPDRSDEGGYLNYHSSSWSGTEGTFTFLEELYVLSPQDDASCPSGSGSLTISTFPVGTTVFDVTPPAPEVGDSPATPTPEEGAMPTPDGSDLPASDPGIIVMRPEPGGPTIIIPPVPSVPGYVGRRSESGVPVPYVERPASSDAMQLALDPNFSAENFGNVQAAFEVLSKATGRSSIWALIDGEAIQLTADDGVSNFTHPALDNLGNRVAYLRTDGNGSTTLEIMGVNGRQRVTVNVMADGADVMAYTPAWSLGENAVYVTLQYDEGLGSLAGIYLVDLTAPDEARARRLIDNGYQPSVNQNGTLLSFVRSEDGSATGQEVFLYARRNARESLLTDSLYGCYDPQFTDDFVRMYMTCNNAEGVGQLHRYDLHGLKAMDIRSIDGTIDRAVNVAVGPNALMIGFDNADQIYWGQLTANVYRPLIMIDNGIASNVSFRALAPVLDIASR